MIDADMQSPAQHWWRWYFSGTRKVVSIPAMILIMMFAGYAIMAREMGLSLSMTIFIGLFLWAIPSQILLLSAIATNAAIPATILTIAFASVRFLPSVVALIPVVRDKKTTFWEMFVISHFSAAVTSWVFAMTEAPKIPHPYRAPFVLGFAITLGICASVIFTALTYYSVSHLSAIASGMIVFLTPVYFLCSVTGSAKTVSDHLAMLFGLGLSVVLLYWMPDYAMLAAGLAGGTLAYVVGRNCRPGNNKRGNGNSDPS